MLGMNVGARLGACIGCIVLTGRVHRVCVCVSVCVCVCVVCCGRHRGARLIRPRACTTRGGHATLRTCTFLAATTHTHTHASNAQCQGGGLQLHRCVLQCDHPRALLGLCVVHRQAHRPCYWTGRAPAVTQQDGERTEGAGGVCGWLFVCSRRHALVFKKWGKGVSVRLAAACPSSNCATHPPHQERHATPRHAAARTTQHPRRATATSFSRRSPTRNPS
jgi:hypothetical protein